MPNGNTAGAERQYRAMDGAVPNRDTEGANRRDYSPMTGIKSSPTEEDILWARITRFVACGIHSPRRA